MGCQYLCFRKPSERAGTVNIQPVTLIFDGQDDLFPRVLAMYAFPNLWWDCPPSLHRGAAYSAALPNAGRAYRYNHWLCYLLDGALPPIFHPLQRHPYSFSTYIKSLQDIFKKTMSAHKHQNRSILTGNYPVLFPDNAWIPLRKLAETTPNDGLLRIYSALSGEALLVTSPPAIRDMLTVNAFDFAHQDLVKIAIKRFTGSNLGFLSNDDFKVCVNSHCLPCSLPDRG